MWISNSAGRFSLCVFPLQELKHDGSEEEEAEGPGEGEEDEEEGLLS